MKKKILALIIACLMLIPMIAACDKSDSSSGTAKTEKPADFDTRTSIRIGMSRPVSGIFASFEAGVFGPV